MSMEINPYAAPHTDVNASPGSQYASEKAYWRSGPILFARNGATLPSRCVKCNADLAEPLKRKRFYWHHQAVFLLVLINVIIYAIAAMIVRRHADLTFGLCPAHRRRRNRFLIGGLAGALVSLLLMVVGMSENLPGLAVFSLVAFLVFLIITVVKGRTLFPVRIDKSAAQLKGCCEAFLASL
jgi:hypothetical protein